MTDNYKSSKVVPANPEPHDLEVNFMKKIVAALIAIASFMPFTVLAVQHADLSDVTIVVSSCDKYSALWSPFFGSLFKYWPALNTNHKDSKILLVANKQQYQHPRITMVNIPTETSWTNNILQALQEVDTKYVLLFLDDYWLNAPVDEQRLAELLHLVRTTDAAMLQISYNDLRYQGGEPHPTIDGVMYRNKYAHYKLSLQLAVWDKQALLDLLRPGENPWEFELAGTVRSHGYPKDIFTVSTNEPVTYINATFQGHVRPEAISHAEAHNFNFDDTSFPVLGKFNPKLAAKIWQARLQKLFNFAKHPGYFIQTNVDNQ